MNHVRIADRAPGRWAVLVGVGVVAACVACGCASKRSEPAVADSPPPTQPLLPKPEVAQVVSDTRPTEAQPSEPAQPHAAGLVELFPHIRLDAEQRFIEFDGFVPIDCHDPSTPIVYLEVIACARDSKEHEALVATDAKPSLIHAALLMLGLEPGSPGRWTMEDGVLISHKPTGSALSVTIAWRRGEEWVEAPAQDWVTTIEGASHPLRQAADSRSWLFAGSRMVTWRGAEFYDADGTGVIIGLTTFGSEVIAWHEVFSHDSTVQTPEWIADAKHVPPVMTPVVVRIKAAP